MRCYAAAGQETVMLADQKNPSGNESPTLQTRLRSWAGAAKNWLGTAARVTARALKWPLLIAVPLGIFTVTAWWSLISALTSDVEMVPDVRGKTVEEARFALASRSLQMEVSENRKFSTDIDKGLVLETDPAIGAQIKRDRTVIITLSAGFKKTLVPDLLGSTITEARTVGERLGLRIRTRDTVYSTTVAQGRIIAQDPEPHSALVTQTVDVLVSAGEYPQLVMVPHLENRYLTAALEELRSTGLQVVVRRRGDSSDLSTADPYELRALRVYRQWPPPGSFIDLSHPEPVILRVEEYR